MAVSNVAGVECACGYVTLSAAFPYASTENIDSSPTLVESFGLFLCFAEGVPDFVTAIARHIPNVQFRLMLVC